MQGLSGKIRNESTAW